MATLDIKDIINPEFGDLKTAHQLERDGLVGSGSTVYRWMNEDLVDWCWIGGVRILVMTQKTKLYIVNMVNRQGPGGKTGTTGETNEDPKQYSDQQMKILKELDITV